MENLNIPTAITNNIKSFIPRDRYMKHPIAKVFKDMVEDWCFLVPHLIDKHCKNGNEETVNYDSVQNNEEQRRPLMNIHLDYYGQNGLRWIGKGRDQTSNSDD